MNIVPKRMMTYIMMTSITVGRHVNTAIGSEEMCSAMALISSEHDVRHEVSMSWIGLYQMKSHHNAAKAMRRVTRHVVIRLDMTDRSGIWWKV